MAKTILKKWGRCDLIIHGATPSIKSIKAEETSFEDISAYLDIYLKGAILLVNLFLPNMKINQFFSHFYFSNQILFYLDSKQFLQIYPHVRNLLRSQKFLIKRFF